jgi:hypothetical protein
MPRRICCAEQDTRHTAYPAGSLNTPSQAFGRFFYKNIPPLPPPHTQRRSRRAARQPAVPHRLPAVARASPQRPARRADPSRHGGGGADAHAAAGGDRRRQPAARAPRGGRMGAQGSAGSSLPATWVREARCSRHGHPRRGCYLCSCSRGGAASCGCAAAGRRAQCRGAVGRADGQAPGARSSAQLSDVLLWHACIRSWLTRSGCTCTPQAKGATHNNPHIC